MANYSDPQESVETSPLLDDMTDEGSMPTQVEAENLDEVEPTWFKAEFTDFMDLYADLDTVAKYFAAHRVWFPRCAHPMQARPICENGYDLLIGRFGNFGYKVEVRIGLDLVPPDADGVYKIVTIPLDDYTPPGYLVDFRSTMILEEKPSSELGFPDEIMASLSNTITRAQWHLDLATAIKFPRFIRAMPQNLIQSAGDKLLVQIVRQFSRRLTYKTQMDFHTAHNITFPIKCKKKSS